MTETKPDGLRRTLTMTAAWDRRHADPKQNYGVHGVELRFSVVGSVGAVSWQLMTAWVLPETQAWWNSLYPDQQGDYTRLPTPATCVWHASVPEGLGAEVCDLLGGFCQVEQVGSISRDDLYVALTERGDEGVWAILENTYHERAHLLRH